MPRLAAVLVLSLLLVLSPVALAWSPLGHRMVGALAERHLDPAVQAEVRRLLAGESDPTLAGVANWADALRYSDPTEFKRTGPWHYVNTPEGSCDYVASRDCPDGDCVIGAIQAQTTILADRSQPLAKRRDALKFLVHFVGDVHQPLHNGNRPDKGGNTFQVSLRTNLQPEDYARKRYVDGVMGTNLHSVWDYYVLASADLTQTQYVDRLDALPWPPMPSEPVTGPEAWSGESCRLIDSRHLYPDRHTMDSAYLDAQRPLAEQRVRQAAWRLAQLLDDALASDNKR